MGEAAMVALHIDPQCGSCRAVADAMDELAMAHEVIRHEAGSAVGGAPAHSLTDEGRTFAGHRAMMEHVEELRRFLKQWTLFQSDTCYCLDDEEACGSGC